MSDTVFDMINAVYYDKTLIFTGATFREKLVSRHQAVNEFIKAISETVLDIIKAAYFDKPLIFIRAAFSLNLIKSSNLQIFKS